MQRLDLVRQLYRAHAFFNVPVLELFKYAAVGIPDVYETGLELNFWSAFLSKLHPRVQRGHSSMYHHAACSKKAHRRQKPSTE